MITKNYKSIFSYLGALTIGLFMASCDQEDNAGLSTLAPTSPSLTVTTEVSSASLIEDNSVYTFTATLSTAQLVDTKLFAKQIDGDATNGADFTFDGGLTIPAGALSATGEIKILADDLIEGTETVTIQIGDENTANAALTTATMEFTILNYTDGDLIIDMGWAMSLATDDAGNEFSATDFADLRLLVSSTPDNAGDIGEADGGSFETFVLAGDTPDGEYYVVADFYAASDIVRDIDLNLEFNQAGVISGEGFSYSAALSNASVCESNFYVMTKIIKSGLNYTFEDVSTPNFASINWGGTDVKDFYAPTGWASHVVTGVDCDGLTISGLNAEWMYEVWGEVIEEEGTVYYTVDVDGIVTIEEQYVFTTSYNGSLYPYTVYGTGVYDEVAGTLDIQYHLDQDGWSVDGYWFGQGGLTTPYFEANLTID